MKSKIVAVCVLLMTVGVYAYAQQNTVPHIDPYHDSGPRTAPYTPAELQLIHEQGQLDQDAQDALDENQLAKAENFARQGSEMGSLQGDDLLAETLYLEGKYDEALTEYQKIVEDEKGDQPRWLLPYAILELRAGDWAKAAAAYNHCQDPRSDNLMYTHSHFDPAVPQPDDLATALHIEMGLQNTGGNADTVLDARAMAEYKQALAIEPNSLLAQLYYGKELLSLGRISDAKAALKAASDASQGDIKSTADEALQECSWRPQK